jgi:uncharacterized repeat protein (TIGR01451 family)
MGENRRTVGILGAVIIALILGNVRLWAAPVLETVRGPAVSAAPKMLSGRVYEGNIGDEIGPPPGVIVRLQRANDPGGALVDPLGGVVHTGDGVTLEIEITNTSDIALTSVHLSESYDSLRLQLVSATPSPSLTITSTTPSQMQAQMNWGDLTMAPPFGFGRPLAPGDSFNVQVRFRAMNTGNAQNCARVLAQRDGGQVGATDCAGVEIRNPGADLQVNKRVIQPISGPAVVSQTVQFEIRLENTGPSPITVLRLHDEYDPAYLSYVDADFDPDDPADDGALDWSSLTGPPPHGFGQPLQPGQAVTFIVDFHAKPVTMPSQLTRNCLSAWYQRDGEPGHETALRCADVTILQEPGPSVEVDKVVYDSRDPANPGDTIKASFVVRNTGTTAFTNIALTDSYDTNCLRFVPLAIPLIAPDDPADDGQLDWSHWVSLTYLGVGSSIQVIPSVHFQAKAGSGCDTTINRLEGVATDERGHQVWDDAQEVVRIVAPGATPTPTATLPKGGVRHIYLPIAIKHVLPWLVAEPRLADGFDRGPVAG